MTTTRVPLRDLMVPLAVLAVLSAVAGMGFRGAFVDWSFVWAPIVAAVGAGAVTALATWRRLLVGEAIAVSLVAFAVLGILTIGGGPTPAAATTFLEGVVGGWADLLTSFTPADVTPEFRALPFTVSWLGGLVGGELLRSTRVPGLPAVGPIIALATSLLFTVEDRRVALAQGLTVIGGTLLLALAQQRQWRDVDDDLTTGSVQRWRGRGLVTAAALLLGVTLLAPLLGPRMPLAQANERFDLRDLLTPPFDPLSVPSPLVGVKGEVIETRADTPVFTIRADQPIERWTTAVLGAYDGVIWSVAESLASDAGQYRAVDSRFPAPPPGTYPDRATVTARVEVQDLPGVWLPRPGWPVVVDFGEDREVQFNHVTGNTALPDGIGTGTVYEVTAHPPPRPGDAALADATVPTGEDDTDLSALPPSVRSLAADLLEGRELGWPQAEAIREEFLSTDTSFYETEQTPPGHSYFRLSEFLADPGRRIGYEEQYAAAAAVIGRVAELPTRVAVGYLVPEDRWDGGTAEVLAGDISAWIEVRTREYGWVAVDVTPDNPRDPDTEEQGSPVTNVLIPDPPPDPPPPPDVQPSERDELDDLESEEPVDEGSGLGLSPIVVVVGASVGGPLALFGLFSAVVLGLKRRRRTRRLRDPVPARRIAGAWSEVADRCREAGLAPVGPTATTRETARVWAGHDHGTATALLTLADDVDRAAFAPVEPSDDEAARAWRVADELAQSMLEGQPWQARWRMRLDPRPLWRRDPAVGAPGRRDEDAR